MVNGKEVPYADTKAGNPAIASAVAAAGYPKAGDAGIVKMSNPFDIFRPQVAAIIGLLFILVIFVTMVYGPIAAMLVELFPTKIRYTLDVVALSHRHGWFGGLLPATLVRDRGLDRRYLCGPLVSDHLRIHHGGRRLFLPAGNQGRRYQDQTNPHADGDVRLNKRPDKPAAIAPRPVPFFPVLFQPAAPTNCSTISRRCGLVRCSIR